MDVWVENILRDRKKDEIYLVDWDRALSGDPEIEFAVLDYCGLLGPDFWRGYGRRPPPEDDGYRTRATFYHLYEVMKYIVIAQGRRQDRRRAAGYRHYALDTLRQLGDKLEGTC